MKKPHNTKAALVPVAFVIQNQTFIIMNTVEGMQNILSIVPSHFIQMFAFIFT